MTETYSFHSELPSGTPIIVEAEITPLVPAHINCAPEDAYPAEGGDAEITMVCLVAEGTSPGFLTEIDVNDLWVRHVRRYPDKTEIVTFELLIDDLAHEAYWKWSDEQ